MQIWVEPPLAVSCDNIYRYLSSIFTRTLLVLWKLKTVLYPKPYEDYSNNWIVSLCYWFNLLFIVINIFCIFSSLVDEDSSTNIGGVYLSPACLTDTNFRKPKFIRFYSRCSNPCAEKCRVGPWSTWSSCQPDSCLSKPTGPVHG